MASRICYFITHPDVIIDPSQPITEWELSTRGMARMHLGLRQPWVKTIGLVYSSKERKAVDGARIIAAHRRVPFYEVAALGENDRSATGFLPPEIFERTADAFFAHPSESVYGWERAVDAQRRIVRAMDSLVQTATLLPRNASIAVVSHGAVGALLRCQLAGCPIDRSWDQPQTNGGNYFSMALPTNATDDPAPSGWLPFDLPRSVLSP